MWVVSVDKHWAFFKMCPAEFIFFSLLHVENIKKGRLILSKPICEPALLRRTVQKYQLENFKELLPTLEIFSKIIPLFVHKVSWYILWLINYFNAFLRPLLFT